MEVKGICKNCGLKIRFVFHGLHFTDNGWYHDEPDNHTIACIPSFAEPLGGKNE